MLCFTDQVNYEYPTDTEAMGVLTNSITNDWFVTIFITLSIYFCTLRYISRYSVSKNYEKISEKSMLYIFMIFKVNSKVSWGLW